MKKKGILTTAVALGLVAPAAVFAQEADVLPDEGDQEITLSGTGANDNEFEDGNFGVSASYGKFFTDQMLVGVRQSINYANAGDNSNWAGATRVFADHHFDMGNWRPFIGANIGWIYGDGVNETGIVSPEAGIKYYVTPTAFGYFQTEYQVFFEEADDVDESFSDGAFAHTVGIGINFE